MINNKHITPFLKWAGGKRQLMAEMVAQLPADMDKCTYMEPFIGGGALLFHLQPQRAIINDFNAELINVYQVIKEDVQHLLADLKLHRNDADYFYQIRAQDRSSSFLQLSSVQRASRFIYLNKTCFNGLYRVNKAGLFNVPFGRYKNPNIVNEEVLTAVSHFLNLHHVELHTGNYATVLQKATPDCFVYLDPPYHPVSHSASFTGYIQGGWQDVDQERLKQACDDLNSRGVRFLLSNSATDFIKNLYADYNITTILASRAINANGAGRGRVAEVLVRNY